MLILATTGLALNHVDDWRLDRHYVSWPWLLDAYGIHAPQPTTSFGDRGYRATLIAGTLYFGDMPVADGESALTGLVVKEPLAVAGLDDAVLLMTTSGEIVERIDLSALVPAPIVRVGSIGDAVVVDSGGRLLVSDPEITGFAAPNDTLRAASLKWSKASEVPAAELDALNERYRGRGISVERLLADLHSGRIASVAGRLVMDVVAILVIVLSISGFVLWARGNRRDGANGERQSSR
jgi:hypothetical protein